MKKICYITTISLSIRAFFIPQLKYLVENGYDVSVICSPDDTLKSDLGDNIHYIPVEIARGIRPGTLLKTIFDLKRVFKEERFDMVQYSTPNASLCASLAGWLAKIKVRNYHLMGLRYLGATGISYLFLKLAERFTCFMSTDIECITPSNLRLAVSQHLFKQKKAVIVGNGSTGGVDMNRFSFEKRAALRNRTRLELSIDSNDFVFGFVGRITKDKGINELLSAFSQLEKKCKLIIVGYAEGIDTIDKRLWEYAEKNNDILILNPVTDIEKYYAAIDVLVLPSYREGFGMVVAEAEAMGTPVIVSNIPGPTDVMQDGITGLSVAVRDSRDLCNKMEYLAETPELVSKMSENSVEFIRNNFSSDMLMKEILKRKKMLIG